MSIASEILRLQNSKKSLKTWLERKGYQIADERLDELIELAKKAVGGIDTSDATATSLDILLGKTAYVNDELVEGTIETYDYSVDEGGDSFPEVVIPQVSNITISDEGLLSFEKPDLSDFDKYNPTFTYIVEVNGHSLTTTKNENIDIHWYFVDGTNNISITIQAVLNDSSEKDKNIAYSMPTQYVQILTTKLPKKAFELCVTAKGTDAYIYGYTGYRYKFDSVNKTIESIGTATSYYQYGGALVGDIIYYFGGYRGQYYDTISKFDTLSNTSTSLATKMPSKRGSVRAIAVDTNIYIIGGSSSDSTKGYDIYKFDTITETINTLEIKLPYYNGVPNVGLYGTDIYIIGGKTNIPNIYKLDTTNDSLTTLEITVTDDRIGLTKSACAVIGNKLYMIGGDTPKTNENDTIAEFDFETQTFNVLDIKIFNEDTTRFNNSACVIGTDIYMFGGYAFSGQEKDWITLIKV